MGEERYDYDVFVSHSRAERGWVRDELLPRLEGAGLRVCLDWRDFQVGVSRPAEWERAATRSRHTLLVLTPAYLADEWAGFGDLLVQALDPAARERRLLPLLKARCDELPLRIRHLTYVNFADPEEPEWAWAQLLTALGAPPLPAAPVEPTPENWCLAHPYGMPPNFTGRTAERALLSGWLESDAIHPLLVLRALGGFGKSALAWHWLLHDVDAARWLRVVWWSFYDQPTFEEFLRRALEYLHVTPLPAGPRQQADALLRLLHQPGTLLILDGFERALRAYGTLDAPYLGDTPPSPDPDHETRTTKHAPRTTQQDCLSPTSDHFLRAVSALPGLHSKVLLTTRLRPCALETYGGDLLAGCREEELAHMQPPDAVAFFRAQGVRGSRAEIEAACAPYGYHPLSLRLLAGLVVRDPQQPGDVAAAEHLDVSGDLVARQHHVLERAYESLAPPGRRLLSRMACFRGPVGYEAIAAIGAGDPGADVGDRQGRPYGVDADLRDLVARGLVHHDRRASRYDLHPIVRRYAYDRLTGGEREEAHRTLRDYFAAVPPPERPRTLDDLAPVIELYHHTVQAGQYDEAYDLLYDRLVPRPLYFQFGAYQLCIELLRAFFPDGEDRLPRLREESAQAWMLNALAASYSLSGQPRRAVPLVEGYISISEKRGDRQNLAIGLVNLATQQMVIGALRPAEANLRRQIALCREIEDEFREAVGHQVLGRLLACRGVWAEAEEELAAALALFDKRRDVQGQCVVWAYRALRALLLARAVAVQGRAPLHAAAHAAARRALDLADEDARQTYPVERDYVRAHWLLGATHRANGDWNEADRHLAEALARCRGINMVEMEADILLDLARLRADAALTPGPSPKAGRGGQALTPGPSPKAGRGEQALTPGPSPNGGRGEQALTPGPSPNAGRGEQALTPDPSPKAGRGESLDEALRLAEEALLITERCGYVLQGADVHLFLAHLALETGDREAAREHARQARELATCDGPPDYTYKVAYDEAGALLAQLR